MNFREIVNAVMDNSHRLSDGDRSQLKVIVNQVYLELCSRLALVTKFATVNIAADSDQVSMADDLGLSDFVGLKYLADGDGRQLRHVDYQEILSRRQWTSSASVQRVYHLDAAETISISPNLGAGDELSVVYYARPAKLVADSTVPRFIPEDFHDAIVLGASARALRPHDPSASTLFGRLYEDEVNKLRTFLNRRQGTGRTLTPPGSGRPRPFTDPGRDTV